MTSCTGVQCVLFALPVVLKRLSARQGPGCHIVPRLVRKQVRHGPNTFTADAPSCRHWVNSGWVSQAYRVLSEYSTACQATLVPGANALFN